MEIYEIFNYVVFFIGCSNNCPSIKYRDYKYGDKVTKIYSGFYKGLNGTIIDRGYTYDNHCPLPSFKVRLNVKDKKEVWIDQFRLFVE